MLSLNIEELGKWESTIPPEYRKLLEVWTTQNYVPTISNKADCLKYYHKHTFLFQSKGDGKIASPSVAVGESQVWLICSVQNVKIENYYWSLHKKLSMLVSNTNQINMFRHI